VSRWRQNLRAYAAYAGALLLLFVVVYTGTNWISAQRGESYRIFTDWELALPFMPGLIVVYFSIGIALCLPLFGLEHHELRPFAMAFALATGIAGVCFLLFPARAGFERLPLVHGYELIFKMLYAFDLPYNTVPSLHVTYSTLTVLAVRRNVRHRLARIGLALWLAAMLLTVVLVRQHHVVDVVTGVVLGMACYGAFARWSASGVR
jgi:membrane-associated phospholipid phosphatase